MSGQKSCCIWHRSAPESPWCAKEVSPVCQHHLLELSQAGGRAGVWLCLVWPSLEQDATNPGVLLCPSLTSQPWLLLSFTDLGPSQSLLSLLHDKVCFPCWRPFAEISQTECLYSLTWNKLNGNEIIYKSHESLWILALHFLPRSPSRN